MCGKAKIWKSWKVLNIAIAVAGGGHVLGKIPVEPAPVLYLSLEDGKKRLNMRI